MSWSFLPELVAAFSGASCSDTDACAPLSTTPMPDQFYWPDKPTEHSRISRFGMTCEPLTGDRGGALLTWFRAGFRARTSALPEKALDWTVSAAGYGERWPASLARFDPDSRLWRTAQHSLLEDSGESSVTWPRSGMTAGGRCWELPMLGRRIKGTDFGFLPTPTAIDAGTGRFNTSVGSSNNRPTLAMMARKQMWPTPQASDNRPRGTHASTARRMQIGKQVGLEAMVKWTTPTAHNAKDGGFASEHGRNTPTLAAQAGGSLNPDWVEWLMGWPIGHTALRPSGTGKYRNVEQQHGDCLQEADA